MPRESEEKQQAVPQLEQFRRNIMSCMELRRTASAEETLRAAAAALKRHDFVTSVRTYLLEKTSLTCVSDPGLAQDLSILKQEHPAVQALFKGHVTLSRPDGYVELAATVAGPPAPTGVIHVVLTRDDADSQMLLRHLFQAASDRLCVLQGQSTHGVTADTLRGVGRRDARDDLFITIVHEIKNPLAAIMAHLDVMRMDRGDDPVVAEHLDVLIPQLSRLSAILDRARTFASTPVETLVPVSIAKSIRDMVELLSYHYRSSGVEFDLDVPEDLPEVAGSPRRLQQVWLNYFNNAFQAIQRKESRAGCIRVKARHDTKLRQVSVEIADSGVGMDRRTLQLVRDLSLARRDVIGTFGIGVRESARILAEHGGSVQISSECGVGTTVRVVLPRAEAQPSQQLKRNKS